MAVYVVTWDLNGEKPNYDSARAAFVRHLEKYDNISDRGLDSVRFVSSTDDATTIRDFLRQKLDDTDRIFISKLRRGERDGWLSKNVWDWIRAHE